jgi:hypothetical protein
MKQFKSVLAMTLVFLSTTAYSAANHSNYLGAGLNIDTYEEDLPGQLDIDDDYRFAPTIGWKHTTMWDNFGFRTGIFGEMKKLNIENNAPLGDDISLTAYYVAVPLNAQIEINDFSIFGGFTPRILVSQSCDDCGSFEDDDEPVYNSYNFGAAWEFHKDFSAEVNFNRGTGDAYKDLGFNTAQAIFYWKI